MRNLLFILGVYLQFLSATPGAAQIQPLAKVQSDLNLIRAFVRDTGSLKESVRLDRGHVLDQMFDWEEIARRSLKDNWINLPKVWQGKMAEAVRRLLIADMVRFLSAYRLPLADQQLRWGDERITNDEARVSVDVLRDEWVRVLFRMTHRSGEWKIVEIRIGEDRIVADRLVGFDDLLSEGYNIEYVESTMLALDQVAVDEFAVSPTTPFPRQWGWRKKDDDAVRQKGLFRVNQEGDNHFVTVRSSDKDIVLVRPFSIPLIQFPNLTWTWRIRGEPSSSGRLGGIGVIFYQNWLGVPVTIRYEWNASAAPCAVIEEEGFVSDTYVRVVRSLPVSTGRWQKEVINVVEDYRRLFNADPPEQTVGVFLISPVESVEADFDDVFFLKTSTEYSCPP